MVPAKGTGGDESFLPRTSKMPEIKLRNGILTLGHGIHNRNPVGKFVDKMVASLHQHFAVRRSDNFLKFILVQYRIKSDMDGIFTLNRMGCANCQYIANY